MSADELKLPKLPEGWRWKINAYGNTATIKLQRKYWFWWEKFDYESVHPDPGEVKRELEEAAEKMYNNFLVLREAEQYAGVVYGG